jgi:hypothetical protein
MKISVRVPPFACLPLACLLALLVAPAPAATAPPEQRGRPGTSVGDEGEPLFFHKAFKEKLNARREKEKKETPTGACRNALEDGDEARIAKHCKKSPGVTLGDLEQTEIRAGGRKTGKKIGRKTRLQYASPAQAFGHEGRDRWDRFVFRPPSTGDVTARQFRSANSNTRDRARGRSVLGSTPGTAAVNDDRDCSDRVTGEHLRDDGCFGGDGSLRRTLEPAEGGCRHVATGTLLPGSADDQEDDCYDEKGALKTSLVELIDEDPESPFTPRTAEGRELRVFDRDGDGAYGEDGPNPTGPVNDDGDCVDRVTSRHLVAPACLDPEGHLKPTLEPVVGGCRHIESGVLLEGDPGDGVEDPCYDAGGGLKTTLAELTDEDDGQPVDDDDDGRFDEDPPSAAPPGFDADCRQLGRDAGLRDAEVEAMVTADGGCDLTAVVVKKVNEKVGVKHGVRAFETDDPNAPPEDPDHPPVEYGEEERVVELTEEVTITCAEGMELDDLTGLCVDSAQVAALAEARAEAAAAPGTGSVRHDVMMGFTFAPPRVRWGLFRHDEVCFWIFGCFTLFEAKIGFDFSIGLGFRLPAEVTVTGVPTTPVLAGGKVEGLETTLMPLDFDKARDQAFCLGQTPPMGDPAYCERFAFQDALVPEQGDELAIRFTAFAGIRVVVVEIPIIDWGIDVDADVPEMCSYVLA